MTTRSSPLVCAIPRFSKNADNLYIGSWDPFLLKAKCIQYVAENWDRSNYLRERLFALPTEMIEKVMIQLHRIEKLDLAALEFFKSTKIETMFLSHIPKLDDAWLHALESYKSITYLDISHAWLINDRWDSGHANAVEAQYI